MLRDWLAPLTVDAFRETHLGRSALARAGTVPCSLLDWPMLGEILAANPDVLVVARGEHLRLPQPRCLDELRAYFRMGIGLAMRHTERCHGSVRAVAEAFESDLGATHVQMFVTPGGTHGFGWHFDDEDVFIAQTCGIKDYYFRPNTVTDGPASGGEFARFADERSTIYSATLVAGDFLYIPARWWHMAICRETALSISVGVTPS